MSNPLVRKLQEIIDSADVLMIPHGAASYKLSDDTMPPKVTREFGRVIKAQISQVMNEAAPLADRTTA